MMTAILRANAMVELTWYSNLQVLEIFDMHNMVLREFS